MAQTQAATSSNKKGWFEIEIQLANDPDDTHVFVGGDETGDFRIRRGEKVIVPPGVVERLNNATQGVAQKDPNNPDSVMLVERKRFAYTVHRVL